MQTTLVRSWYPSISSLILFILLIFNTVHWLSTIYLPTRPTLQTHVEILYAAMILSL